MKVVRDGQAWWIELAETESRLGSFADEDQAFEALDEVQKLKDLLQKQLGYRLVRPLGKGNFGQVWEAMAPGDVPVALKVVGQLNRFQGRREFRALERFKHLKHPYLSPTYAFWLVELPDKTGKPGRVLDHNVMKDEFESSYIAESPAGPADTDEQEMGGTLATPGQTPMGGSSPTAGSGSSPGRSGSGGGRESAASDRRLTKLIIAMQLGDMTLMDRLESCLAEPESEQRGGNRGIPEHELLEYMRCAGQALTSLNIDYESQHCDVKPQNILLVSNTAQVCDFGILRHGGDLRQTRSGPVFTPYYAAPEQHCSDFSDKIDQYCLALTYAHLYTGRLPVTARTTEEAYAKKLQQQLDFEGIPTHQRRVLEKAAMPDPESRYEAIAQFVSALEEAARLDNLTWWGRARKYVYATAILGLIVALFCLWWISNGDTRIINEIRAALDTSPPQYDRAIAQLPDLSEKQRPKEAAQIFEKWRAAAEATSPAWKRLEMYGTILARMGRVGGIEKKLASLREDRQQCVAEELRLLEERVATNQSDEELAADLQLAAEVRDAVPSTLNDRQQASLDLVTTIFAVERRGADPGAFSKAIQRTETRMTNKTDLLAPADRARGHLYLAIYHESLLSESTDVREIRPVMRDTMAAAAVLERPPAANASTADWRAHERFIAFRDGALRRRLESITYNDLLSIQEFVSRVYDESIQFLLLRRDLQSMLAQTSFGAPLPDDLPAKLAELSRLAGSPAETDMAKFLAVIVGLRQKQVSADAAAERISQLEIGPADRRQAFVEISKSLLDRLEQGEQLVGDPLSVLAAAREQLAAEQELVDVVAAATLAIILGQRSLDEGDGALVAQLEAADLKARLAAVDLSEYTTVVQLLTKLARAELMLTGGQPPRAIAAKLEEARPLFDAWKPQASPLLNSVERYLVHLTACLHGIDDAKAAAQLLAEHDAAYWLRPGWGNVPTRRARQVELLKAAASELTPNDSQFRSSVTQDAGLLERTRKYATLALELTDDETSPETLVTLRTYRIVVTNLENRESTTTLLPAAEVREVLREADILQRIGLLQEVRLALAAVLVREFESNQNPASGREALALLVEVFKAHEGRSGAENALWQRVLEPAVTLTRQLDLAPDIQGDDFLSVVAPQENADLAKIFSTRGRLARSSAQVRERLGEAEADLIARRSLETAAVLDSDSASRFQTFAELAVLLRDAALPNRGDQLLALAKRMEELDDARPEGHALEGYAQTVRARAGENEEVTRELLSKARTALATGIQRAAQDPARFDLARYRADLALVLFELAFYEELPTRKRPLLEESEETAMAAREAARESGDFSVLYDALDALGSCSEDQARYLGRFWKYEQAKDSFAQAIRAAVADDKGLAVQEARTSKLRRASLRVRIHQLADNAIVGELLANHSQRINENLQPTLEKYLLRGAQPGRVLAEIEQLLQLMKREGGREAARAYFWEGILRGQQGSPDLSLQNLGRALELALDAHDEEAAVYRATLLQRQPALEHYQAMLDGSLTRAEIYAIHAALTKQESEAPALQTLLDDCPDQGRFDRQFRDVVLLVRLRRRLKQMTLAQLQNAAMDIEQMIDRFRESDCGSLEARAHIDLADCRFGWSKQTINGQPGIQIEAWAKELHGAILRITELGMPQDTVNLRIYLLLQLRNMPTFPPVARTYLAEARQPWDAKPLVTIDTVAAGWTNLQNLVLDVEQKRGLAQPLIKIVEQR